MTRGFAVLGFALLAGACASVPSGRTPAGSDAPAATRPAPNVNLSGYNNAFKEGYADGCHSVRQAQRRNTTRYGTDADYTMGWNDGHAMCAPR